MQKQKRQRKDREKIERRGAKQKDQSKQNFLFLSPVPWGARNDAGGARGATLLGNFDSRFLPFFPVSPFWLNFSDIAGVEDGAVKV